MSPTQVLLHGVLENGATASVTVHGGSRSPDGLFVKFVGPDGTSTVTPTRPGTYVHWTDWDIRLNGEQVKVPDDYQTVPFDPAAGPVASVAAVHQESFQPIAEGRRPQPDFHTAAAHHRALAAVERAAGPGRRGGGEPLPR